MVGGGGEVRPTGPKPKINCYFRQSKIFLNVNEKILSFTRNRNPLGALF